MSIINNIITDPNIENNTIYNIPPVRYPIIHANNSYNAEKIPIFLDFKINPQTIKNNGIINNSIKSIVGMAILHPLECQVPADRLSGHACHQELGM
jgi:hypothetical protein